MRPTLLLLLLHAIVAPIALLRADPIPSAGVTVTNSSSRFVVVTNLQRFTRTVGTNAAESVFTSPVLTSPIPWDEFILSWNVQHATNAGFKFEVCPIWTDDSSRFYNLGYWTAHPGTHRRQSVNGQKDSVGSVETDTLLLTKLCRAVQLRITISPASAAEAGPPIEFLGLSLFNRQAYAGLATNLLTPSEVLLPVPQRSQIAYEGGRDWCSPTSVSMVLGYWAERLKRPALAVDVQAVAAAVHDPEWPGTGNWPFNTAFAGKHPGLRAYITRLSGVSDLQLLLKAGIPPIVSVSFDLLNGKEKDQGAGHLIVCVGTTPGGDFIINDPWANLDKGERVQRVVSVQRLARGWSRSRGVVYLIHPTEWEMPAGLRLE